MSTAQARAKGSVWSTALYLKILAKNDSCDMSMCIWTAQARAKFGSQSGGFSGARHFNWEFSDKMVLATYPCDILAKPALKVHCVILYRSLVPSSPGGPSMILDGPFREDLVEILATCCLASCCTGHCAKMLTRCW